MLVIRSVVLTNVMPFTQSAVLKGTKSSDSLASSGLLVTCQMTYSVVKKRIKNIYKF